VIPNIWNNGTKPEGKTEINLPGFGPGGRGLMRTDIGPFSITHSPLVLDLEGDGIVPTSVVTGVSFDLMGIGEIKTAWVQGDDALLALDRNGNGRIDSGKELFGSSTSLAGVPADNGFKALAELDRSSQGGNGNGRIDAGDKQFSDLRVWQDANRDGVSQREELLPLSKVGVRSIDLDYRLSTQIDAHGNDLSLQGSFSRNNGSKGQVIDVFFVVTAP
jgi:hypothetical protein